jgi:hypothetical protein
MQIFYNIIYWDVHKYKFKDTFWLLEHAEWSIQGFYQKNIKVSSLYTLIVW